jgi:AraC-like DNA-binding protein
MRAATLEEFARDPVGRFVCDATFLHFCARPSLWGVLLWGRPTATDAFCLGRSLVLELAPPAEPHVSIVDASRLEGGDQGAFQAFQAYIAHYGEKLAHWVERLALVRPKGLSGAMVAGAYEVMPAPYPVAVFDEAGKALAWLAEGKGSESSPEAMLQILAELHAVAAQSPELFASLKALLDTHLEGISVADAATTLGVSTRTLQRKLSGAKTTFQNEMTDARVRAAKSRLLDGDAALTTIAIEVGFASLQSFTASFRRRTGETPSDWRRRKRGGVELH